MSETFYRVHNGGYEFSADNAWSSSPGLDRSEDGTEYECECTVIDGAAAGDCRVCDGTGWAPCDRGYSCFDDPQALVDYYVRHLAVSAGDTVVIFAGYRTGTGPDGEQLAVPEQVTETLTWAEFTARVVAA